MDYIRWEVGYHNLALGGYKKRTDKYCIQHILIKRASRHWGVKNRYHTPYHTILLPYHRKLKQACVPFVEDDLLTVGLEASAEGNTEKRMGCWNYSPRDLPKKKPTPVNLFLLSALWKFDNSLVNYWELVAAYIPQCFSKSVLLGVSG